jgi:hypothetical protein
MADVIRELVLKELVGGLWHTTHPDRFPKILESGGISPEPAIPQKDRWDTRDARESSSYVRFIGGVSLFDLCGFAPESYLVKFPSSTWHYFIPFHLMWGCAVWIEINRDRVASHLISPIEVKNKWESEKAYRHRTVPGIEAAYMGVLPRTAFKRAFMVRKDDTQLYSLEI